MNKNGILRSRTIENPLKSRGKNGQKKSGQWCYSTYEHGNRFFWRADKDDPWQALSRSQTKELIRHPALRVLWKEVEEV